MNLPVQLLDSEPDTGKRIVPFHTGKVAIGIAYTPKPTIQDARCIEKYTAPKSPFAKWIGWSVAALTAFYFIVRA